MTTLCRTYWGSHGCDLTRGHEGVHRCQGDHPCSETDGTTVRYYDEDDGAWSEPLIFSGRLFGEDAHMTVPPVLSLPDAERLAELVQAEIVRRVVGSADYRHYLSQYLTEPKVVRPGPMPHYFVPMPP